MPAIYPVESVCIRALQALIGMMLIAAERTKSKLGLNKDAIFRIIITLTFSPRKHLNNMGYIMQFMMPATAENM